MQRISTNLTLFYKFFLPIFWTVFFGATTIAVMLMSFHTGAATLFDNISIPIFRIGTVFFFLTGVAFLYWAFFRLKRVERDEHFIYVTNYFKTARYPYHNIEQIEENDFLISTSVSIVLKKAGIFGKRITFIPSQKRYKKFKEEHLSLFVEN